MISVQEAKNRILNEIVLLPVVRVPLEKALHRILAQDIQAPLPLPLYDNSAMDGFALKSEETRLATPHHPILFQVVGIQRAGDPPAQPIKLGEAIRIMTGATIPKGTDAVVMKEVVAEKNGKLLVSTPISAGANIRNRGEEVQKGSLILSRGRVLTSRSIGLLANTGLRQIIVYRIPKIALIVTGSELITAPQKRRHGQIYDSNTPMLLAALQEINLEAASVHRVTDHEKKIKVSLQGALEKSDVILLVGGISVGDYDFSKSVLGHLGVKTIFWNVAQKPGKPLYFGQKGRKLVFGLPGNPVSAWVCFHQYVSPALFRMQGFPDPAAPPCSAILGADLKADSTKTLFLKGRMQKKPGPPRVSPLLGQGSHMLKTLAEANCLIQVPPQHQLLPKGSEVEVYPLSEGVREEME